MSDLPVIRASDAEREQAVARLRDASVEGRLTLEEFTDRMQAVYAAQTHDELETLLRDLPASAPAPESAVTRRAVSIMGNTRLDLREAAADTTVSVLCVMGNVDVIVPRGARVELDAVAIMGNRHAARPREETNGPLVRVKGFVLMGNVSVKRA